MLNQILRSRAETSWQNQGPRGIFGGQVEKALPTQSDQPLEILVPETVPLGMRNVRHDMAGAALTTDTVLCRLARRPPKGT